MIVQESTGKKDKVASKTNRSQNAGWVQDGDTPLVPTTHSLCRCLNLTNNPSGKWPSRLLLNFLESTFIFHFKSTTIGWGHSSKPVMTCSSTNPAWSPQRIMESKCVNWVYIHSYLEFISSSKELNSLFHLKKKPSIFSYRKEMIHWSGMAKDVDSKSLRTEYSAQVVLQELIW